MSLKGKGRCATCGRIYTLRKDGLLIRHPPYHPCPGSGQPPDTTTPPTWETRAKAAERNLANLIERLENLPTHRGYIKVSDLTQAIKAET